MAHWNEGYLTDIDYTHGYFSELDPSRVKLAFLAAGLDCPKVVTACELGFGHGMSINMHAAAGNAEWLGTDFVPSQTAFARQIAEVGGSRAQLFDQSFAEFCSRADLPDFDLVCLHGIWSWISIENRKVIVDFLRRKLKVGGVFYISYNCLPGWSAFAPLRHLLSQHAKVFGSRGKGVVSKINDATAFAASLLDTKPAWLQAVPLASERLKELRGKNPIYLAPEYLGDHWEPMYFSTVAQWLEPAKLSFACSAHLTDHVDRVNLTPEHSQMLVGISNPVFAQTLRDYMVNQVFRRDYWVKGPRKMASADVPHTWENLRFMLGSPRSGASFQIMGALGEGSLNEALYAPFFDFMADHQPHSFAEIQQQFEGTGLSKSQVKEAVVLLTGSNQIALVQEDSVIAKAKKTTARLNQHILSRSKASNDLHYLASPVTGGGVGIGRFQQLFLQACMDGKRLPAELAEAAWETLAGQSQKIVKGGMTLTTVEENIAELNAQAIVFIEKHLPVLKALQIA